MPTFSIVAAGGIIVSTIVAEVTDGGTKTQALIMGTAALVCAQIILQGWRDRQKWKRDDQERLRKEADDKKAAIDRQQLKDNMQAVHTRTESIAETTADVRTELARNTEITQQAARAVTDGFKDSVAHSLRAAFDERFGPSDPNKPNDTPPAGG